MKHHGLIPQIVAFSLACVLGMVITLLGLRLYFNNARLESSLTRVYQGKDFQVLAGQAKITRKDVSVNSLGSDDFSFINAGFLHVDSRFYERIVVRFDDIHPGQPILFAVRYRADGESDARVAEKPLVMSNLTGEHLIEQLLPKNAVAIDIGLITNQLLSSYRLQSIKLVPKKLDSSGFLALLWDCFAINKQWENWSINTHKSPHQVLIPPKMLVFLIFSTVGVIFALYLWLTGRRVINAWWTTIIVAWLALDLHYLVEKTVITKNTYDTFAHLSDDEKDLVLSPEPARLAQMIKSVLPDDGKPKKIRIQMGWKNEGFLRRWQSKKRYLDGKIHYFLAPHDVYTFGIDMPQKAWLGGGFYYVEFRTKNQQLRYDETTLTLRVSEELEALASLLFKADNLAIYYVHGDKRA